MGIFEESIKVGTCAECGKDIPALRMVCPECEQKEIEEYQRELERQFNETVEDEPYSKPKKKHPYSAEEE